MAVESYPWRFSSVISVGSHEERRPDALLLQPRAAGRVLRAAGSDIEVAWSGGETLRCSGNSFATAHICGICALIRAKHPELTPFELKSVLRLTAANAAAEASGMSEERACGPPSPPRRWPESSAQRELLQSIVDVARAIFDAKAASITLYDEETDELVFEAVSGEG